jgi:diguanylate cyclase (GGDEF)-like protein
MVVGSNGAEAIPLPVPALQVDNIYEALGIVTSSTSRNPVALVLLRPESLPLNAARAADAIRQIDPSVRIALVGPSTNGDVDASVFDAVLQTPIDTDRIDLLLDGEPEPPSPRPATPPSKARKESPPVDDRDLGDVDLVGVLLNGEETLRDVAVRLIVQQTGWSDVTFAEPGDDTHEGAGAEVTHEEHHFGRLRTKSARAAELAPWADWLARWLALDRSYREHRLMAFQDDLTGAWNRRFFYKFLTETLERARELRRQITVMVFDIDNFKQYNDQFGHEAGDVVLIETVKLLNSVIRKGDRVCRIGGDEFAVIFADLEAPREVGSTHPATPERIAARFQDQICDMQFPKLGRDAPGSLSISAGLATFPWDGPEPDELLRCADRRALQSKRKGKNAITLGPAAGPSPDYPH